MAAIENEKSVSLDGVDDYINCGSDSSLDDFWSGGASFEGWFKLESYTNNARFADKGTWRIYTNGDVSSNTRVFFRHEFSSTQGVWRSTAFNIPHDGSTWIHIKVEYDSDDVTHDPSIWVNGVSSTIFEVTTPVGTAQSDAASDFLIGESNLGGNNLHALVDEVAVWSATGTANLYNSGTPTDLSDDDDYDTYCISWWRCGDGDTFSTITDQKGSNDGTMVNMAAEDFVDDVPGTPPQSADLGVIPVTATPVDMTITPGAVTIDLDTIPVTVTPVGVTITPGAVAIDLDTIPVTVTPVGVTITPGAVTINLDGIPVTATPVGVTVTPGAVAIDLDVIPVTATPVDMTAEVSGGEQTADLGVIAVTAAPVGMTVTPGAISTDLDVIPVTVTPVDMTITPGAVAIDLNAIPATVVPVAMTVAAVLVDSLGAIPVIVSPVGMTITPGAVSIDLDVIPVVVTPIGVTSDDGVVPEGVQRLELSVSYPENLELAVDYVELLELTVDYVELISLEFEP